jgi:ubiquitin-protein ligase
LNLVKYISSFKTHNNSTEDPLVADIADQLEKDPEKHNQIAKEWTKKFAR